MYAYVKYLSDGQKEIVPLKFILNLDESEAAAADSKIIYKIFWTSATEEDSRLERFESFLKKAAFDKNLLNVVDFKKKVIYKKTAVKKRGNVYPPDGFYEGNVLLIKDTIEDIEQIVDEISPKRLRHPTRKILQSKIKPSSTKKKKENLKLVKKKLQNEAALASIGSILNLQKDEPAEVDKTTDQKEDENIPEVEGKRKSDLNDNIKKIEGGAKKRLFATNGDAEEELPATDTNDKEEKNENKKKIGGCEEKELPAISANYQEEKNGNEEKIGGDVEKKLPTTDAKDQQGIMIIANNEADENRKIDENHNGKEKEKNCKSENDDNKDGEAKLKNMAGEGTWDEKPKKNSPKASPKCIIKDSNSELEESSEDDFSSGDSDDDIVPNRIHEKLKQKYNTTKEKNVELEKKLKHFETDFDDLKVKFEELKRLYQQEANEKKNCLRNKIELEKELDKIKEEKKSLKRKLENYQEINLNLQKELFVGVKRFKTEESKNKPDSDQRTPEHSKPEEQLAERTLFRSKIEEPGSETNFDHRLSHHSKMNEPPDVCKPDSDRRNPHSLKINGSGFEHNFDGNSSKHPILNDSDTLLVAEEKKCEEPELGKGEDLDESNDFLNQDTVEGGETVDVYGFEVEKDKYDLIREKKYNDSKFCQALAEQIWKEKLLERSITGQKAKKPGSTAKKPVTPNKVDAIRSALKDKIKEQEPSNFMNDPEQFAVRTSVEKVKSHIKTKIYNLKKKKPE